jgi:hypothetical protein
MAPPLPPLPCYCHECYCYYWIYDYEENSNYINQSFSIHGPHALFLPHCIMKEIPDFLSE